jgi:hypothetical protein
MKVVSSIACCTVLAGLSIGTASAQPISVKVTGHVVSWQDNTGLVGPYLPPSSTVTAVYTYDPNEAASLSLPPGRFSLPSSHASIVINIGPFTFQTGQTSRLEAQVTPGIPGSNWGSVAFQGYQNPSLPNGVPVDFMSINFLDSTGQWPTSSGVPDGAPNLTSLADSQITVSGPWTMSGYYQIMAQVDSVELLPPAIEVSPSAGSFLPQQHFDAAILLPVGGAPVATAQASVGGNSLALNYPGTCQLAPPNNSGRGAILCPGADAALTSLQGITQVDWQVTLTDGSSFTRSVLWNLIR